MMDDTEAYDKIAKIINDVDPWSNHDYTPEAREILVILKADLIEYFPPKPLEFFGMAAQTPFGVYYASVYKPANGPEYWEFTNTSMGINIGKRGSLSELIGAAQEDYLSLIRKLF